MPLPADWMHMHLTDLRTQLRLGLTFSLAEKPSHHGQVSITIAEMLAALGMLPSSGNACSDA